MIGIDFGLSDDNIDEEYVKRAINVIDVTLNVMNQFAEELASHENIKGTELEKELIRISSYLRGLYEKSTVCYTQTKMFSEEDEAICDCGITLA